MKRIVLVLGAYGTGMLAAYALNEMMGNEQVRFVVACVVVGVAAMLVVDHWQIYHED